MSAGWVAQLNISGGGVPKRSIERADVGPLGIAGDGHRYWRHGGKNKALLLLAAEAIDALRAEGWPVFYGALGENVTTCAIDYRAWRSGQRWQMGEVLVELTTPREPCKTLAPYGKGIQKRILSQPGESGFYARVITAGLILPKDIIVKAETTP